MDLTRRQEAFVRSLIDLYAELRGPIHYSVLAERLSVSPFTAYDMLRLLEDRGYVRSEYYLDESPRGPGRSTVLFHPTDKARGLLARYGADPPDEDWRRVKDALLDELRSGRIEDRDMAAEVLAHAPQDDDDVVRYCAEVATVLVLRLWRGGGVDRAREYLETCLSGAVDARRERLLLLTGFATGVLAGQDDPRDQGASWIDEALEHVHRYLAYVSDMDDDERRRLAAALDRSLSPLLAQPRRGAQAAAAPADGPGSDGPA